MQDYYQGEMLHFSHNGYSFPFQKIAFYYEPSPKQKGAALNFHLTTQEKLDIKRALQSTNNTQMFEHILNLERKGTAIGAVSGGKPLE